MGEENSDKIEQLAAIGNIAAGVAHDLKNILTGLPDQILICSHLSEIKKSLSDEQQNKLRNTLSKLEEYAANIRISVSLGRELCDFILECGSTAKKLEPKPAHLDKILIGIITYLKSHLAKNEIELDCDISSDVILICNQVRMRQLFLNLLSNAIFAVKNSAKKKIYISLSRTQDTIILLIQDTGCGIPKNKIPHIFDAGFTTKEKDGSGYGLGLTTVRAVVEEHSGSIIIESNGGTTFKIKFPPPAL